MSPQHSALLQFEPEGLKTVRVFSDGVPERDYPRKGCQLAVLTGRKDNDLGREREASSKTAREVPGRPPRLRCSAPSLDAAPDPATGARSASRGYRDRSPRRQCAAEQTPRRPQA